MDCSSHALHLMFLGLAGKDNWQRAWCDVIVDVLKETRDYLKPFMTFYRTEKDEAKFVSYFKLILICVYVFCQRYFLY